MKLYMGQFGALMLLAGAVGFGCGIGASSHSCPAPSVSHVQRELNKVVDPLFPALEVDGVAGSKTVHAWMFYSTGWEEANIARRIK